MVVPTFSWGNLPTNLQSESLFTSDAVNDLFENIQQINSTYIQQKLTNDRGKRMTGKTNDRKKE